jgi:hypothetical protein
MSNHGNVGQLELQLLGSSEAVATIVETSTTLVIPLQAAVLHLGRVIATVAMIIGVEMVTMAPRKVVMVLHL